MYVNFKLYCTDRLKYIFLPFYLSIPEPEFRPVKELRNLDSVVTYYKDAKNPVIPAPLTH